MTLTSCSQQPLRLTLIIGGGQDLQHGTVGDTDGADVILIREHPLTIPLRSDRESPLVFHHT